MDQDEQTPAEEALRLQSSLALELLTTLDRHSVFRLLARRIHALAGGAIVATSEFEPRGGRVIVRSLQCTPEERRQAAAIMGRDPEGLSLRFLEETRDRWTVGALAVVPGGVYDLLFGQVPEETCRVLEATMGLGDIYGMACAYEEDILGTVAVLTRGRDPVPNRKLIEALVAQAALALKRIRSDEVRAETEERLRLLFETTSDGIWIHTLDGVISEVNDAYCAMSGYTREELRGMPISRLEAVESDAEIKEHIERLIRLGGHDRFESKHRRKDGSVFDVEITAVFLPPEEGRIAIFARDITERKRDEEALRRSEARLGLLSRTAGRLLATEDPQIVVNELCREVMKQIDCQIFFNYLVDPSGGGLRLNSCAGIADEEAKRIEELDFGAFVCGCVARDRRRIIAEDIQNTQDPRANLVRSYGIQAYCCHPLLAQGQLIGTLSFGTRTRPRFTAEEVELMRTIADQVATAMQRIQVMRALSLANEQLVEAGRRKDEFLALLSHELRNPLAPVQNSLYVLGRAEPGGEQARRALAVIERQVGQLVHLVDDLLDVTRIERGKMRIQPTEVELVDLVRQAIEDHRGLFDESGLELDVDVAGGPIFVDADRIRITQIVGNLLQNATKFTPRGGRVTVSVSMEKGQARAVIRVRDTGIGMDPESLARLFQPFMQVDSSLDRSRGGLGLGLALVKGFAELHGGRVSASSPGLGRGLEITVRLPLRPAPAPAGDAGGVENPTPGRRLLIIEDSADAAHMLSAVLRMEGHEVQVAHTGPEGLVLAREFRPEVVLSDIGLPGMSGYDVARAFRSDPALEGMFLIALSGYGRDEDIERSAGAGFDRHLTKPLDVTEFRRVLAEVPEANPARGIPAGD